ncbi:hypothetical protein HYPSUDRAFT_162137 [Hypholoma sublateritium FD-334 SS-4]|uniref:RTA1 like protein n=1 Tax=Hypholoma sublateritium (strain FD-334 SS-4) TaxID=945553 RepID=A0A0D2P6U0_HYPSF|nr:hypothetical protein HYPSUDRAFT_162137 [Hypholoma sublateritium FD-334 SS-4]
MSGNNGTNNGGLDTNPNTAQYGYVPSKALAIIFITLFIATTLTHFVQAIRYRTWFMLFTACLCGMIEIAGWFGRGWSGFSPSASTPFEIQIIATIVAPTPLIAASFVIFGRIIRQLGQQYSRLRPRLYTIIFTSCDVISLVVQGFGGGVAAGADTLVGANKGAHIMLIGIVFQLVIIIIFASVAVDFFLRYRKDTRVGGTYGNIGKTYSNTTEGRPGELTADLRLMIKALIFNMSCLFIRSIYRIIELSGGWDGTVLRTQVYFVVFDGVMVILAIYTTNIIHPGVYLASVNRKSTMSMENLSGAGDV